MQLILDLYDAAGARVGDGPITTLTGATVSRMLDGVGTISFEVPATDERALALLTTRRRFRLFVDYQAEKREIGRGIVLRRDLRESDEGALVAFDCADSMAELKDANTLIGLTYSQKSIATIVNGLIALATGWTATVEAGIASKLTDARFDGTSVLEALLALCKNNGIHLRLGSAGRTIEVGVFGALASVRAVNVENAAPEIYMRDDVALISSLNAGLDAEEIVNWMLPLGGGEDAASLKLKKSTRVSPYTIQNAIGPNGRKYWYLADTASITAYGRSQRVVTFKGIKPISNSATDKVNAGNALYDAAAAYLQRAAVPQKNYKVWLTALKQSLRPGDKLHVRFKGRVMKDGVPVDWADINEDLWMLSVGESYGLDSSAVDVEVSNVDKSENSIEETIVDALNEISLRGLTPLSGVSCRSYVYQREIGAGFRVLVPIEVTNATLDVIRVRVRFKTSPLRVVDHRHMMMQRVAQFANAALVPNWLQVKMMGDGGGLGSTNAVFLPNVSDPGSDLYTYGPASSSLNGVVDDTTTPINITVRVNGTNRTTELGGPWAGAGGNVDAVLDIGKLTEYIVDDPGGLYKEHELDFRCTSGFGRCEVTVEVYEVLQSIDVS